MLKTRATRSKNVNYRESPSPPPRKQTRKTTAAAQSGTDGMAQQQRQSGQQARGRSSRNGTPIPQSGRRTRSMSRSYPDEEEFFSLPMDTPRRRTASNASNFSIRSRRGEDEEGDNGGDNAPAAPTDEKERELAKLRKELQLAEKTIEDKSKEARAAKFEHEMTEVALKNKLNAKEVELRHEREKASEAEKKAENAERARYRNYDTQRKIDLDNKNITIERLQQQVAQQEKTIAELKMAVRSAGVVTEERKVQIEKQLRLAAMAEEMREFKEGLLKECEGPSSSSTPAINGVVARDGDHNENNENGRGDE